MRAGQGILELVRPDPHHQVIPDHAAAHVAFDHEGDAAEHPLLGELALPGKDPASALGQFLVVGHRREVESTAARTNCRTPAAFAKGFSRWGI